MSQSPAPQPSKKTHVTPTGSAHSRISVVFGDPILDAGHTATPNLILNSYARLSISPQEMMFVVHLLQHKWDARNPYPSLGLVASRMGVSLRQVQRYEASLVKKGFLSVYARMSPDRGQLSNEYNFTPLIERILALDAQSANDNRQSAHTNISQSAAISNKAEWGSGETEENRTEQRRRKVTPMTVMSSPPMTVMSPEEDSPQTDTIIDQIDREEKEDAKRRRQETPQQGASSNQANANNSRHLTRSADRHDQKHDLHTLNPSSRAPQKELKSLKELLSTGLVVPASTLPDTIDVATKKGRVRGEKGAKRRTIGKRGAQFKERATAAYSTSQHQIAPQPQSASLMPSARIAETVKRISREFGDLRVEANTRQLMGLYHRSGMSESAFEDWLYTIRAELKERRGSIKKPMAYLYTTLKNRLRL